MHRSVAGGMQEEASLGTIARGFAETLPFSRLFAFSANFGDHSVKTGGYWGPLYGYGITFEHAEGRCHLVHYTSRSGSE